MSLTLTVLGSAGSHPGPGRVCSGYLVQADAVNLLLDAGNGSTANLQRDVALRDLDAVLVSHRHLDHCIDLVGAFYALHFDPAFDQRIPLYTAPEVHELLTGLLSGDSAMAFDEVFEHREVAPGDRITVGPLELRFVRADHPVPALSVRVELDGHSLVYSGDTAGGDELVELARGADLFLCEATWAGDAGDYPANLHMTAHQAADHARRAGVGRLLLTHVAGGTDRARVLAEASEVFDGPVALAEDLDRYTVA